MFAREFRAHPAEEYERCIRAGTLTVNYQKVDVDYRLRHNDLLANVVHRYVSFVPSQPSYRVRGRPVFACIRARVGRRSGAIAPLAT